jgi:hypothetical protein
MSIALEFIDFIVPIALIRQRYPGGWEQCLKDHAGLLGGRVWFDEHLLRDGAMSPQGIAALVREWSALGFQPTEERDGQYVWKDCCVVESLFGGATLPCDWLAIGEDGSTAYLKGTEPGPISCRPSRNRIGVNKCRDLPRG